MRAMLQEISDPATRSAVASPAEEAWRDHFLMPEDQGRIYFDSAATSLKLQSVADAMVEFYRNSCSNVGRANHLHAEQATLAFEAVRSKASDFLNCYADEIVFTMNCTDSINLVAQSLALEAGAHVIVSELEHHSNLLPWLVRADVSVVRTDAEGVVDLDHLQTLLRSRPTRLVAVCLASNITGNVQPVTAISDLAHQHGALVLIDAAQGVGHVQVDVAAIDCDLLAFSAHKMFGPSGVGVLYMRREVQAGLRNVRTGGGMINRIDGDRLLYHSGPARFEAGTPNIEGVLGLGHALDFLQGVGIHRVEAHDQALEHYFWQRVPACRQIVFPFPRAPHHLPIFTLRPRGDVDINYVSRLLSDRYQIATGAGYQCNQPYYRSRGLNGGIRISMHLYNRQAEIDLLFDALEDMAAILA